MTEWRPVEADAEMTEKIKSEFRTIYAHLGDEAPDPSTEIEVMVNKDGDIRFRTPFAAYAVTRSGAAVCFRLLHDGAEEATYWRDGDKVRHIVLPPIPRSN